jgi:hypothetical protein
MLQGIAAFVSPQGCDWELQSCQFPAQTYSKAALFVDFQCFMTTVVIVQSVWLFND